MATVSSVYPYPIPARVGILLAAGRGSRYAAPRPGADKLLAPRPQGARVAAASARTLRAAVDMVVAVVRPGSAALAGLLRAEDCVVLETDRAEEGMGASLAAAAQYLQGLPGTPATVLVALADMPWIQRASLASVLEALRDAPMAAPSYQGQRGHPVGFRGDLLAQLAALRGDEGARRLLKGPGLQLVPVDDPGVLRDVDTPADLDEDG
ncbi:nucleotidyltransferase family protein [Achromobacter aegrifaciens]|uniref:nucleotidyltransferase family protein n=1 Tax=Achromobacter aegrifaciens TaxID=1287736 RepID=UPI000F736BE2|nr:nucleotidyltransferase family protein [Achromobacter aegrifaciens]RSF02513.1 nucleotidyltransferase family protein [Achromobacter aegrifaciens]